MEEVFLTNSGNLSCVGGNKTKINPDGGMSNNCTLPPDMTFGEAQIISISVYTPLFILSAILNLRVLGKLLKAKERAGLSRLNQLLLHLVLGDLLVTFLMMPLEIVWAMTVSWWAGDFLCRVFSFFRIFGLFLSSNIVVCISIDRFLAILKPFSVRKSSRRMKVMLVTAWVLAVLLSLPQCWIFHVEKHPDFPWYEQCVTFGSFSSRTAEFLYFFLGMIFFYILPLVVIVVSYGGIIIHLHRKSYFEPAREVARICGSSPRENENQPRHLEWPQHHFNEDEDFIPTSVFEVQRGQIQEAGGKFEDEAAIQRAVDSTFDLEMRRTNPGMIGKAKLNTIKITIALVAAFLACWTPYYVMCVWFWADRESYGKVDYRIRKFLFLFACTNSCANPIIYGLFSDRRAGIFSSRERVCFMPASKAGKHWNKTFDKTEDELKMEDLRIKGQKRPPRSRSLTSSPVAIVKAKTVTTTVTKTTELWMGKWKSSKSSSGCGGAREKSSAFRKRARSSPSIFFSATGRNNKSNGSENNSTCGKVHSSNSDKGYDLVTEVHLRTNDITLRVIQASNNDFKDC